MDNQRFSAAYVAGYLLMNLREANFVARRAIIEAAISEAITAIPTMSAARGGSTPNDTGMAGYMEADEDDIVSYRNWFRAGDYPGVNLVRPY